MRREGSGSAWLDVDTQERWNRLGFVLEGTKNHGKLCFGSATSEQLDAGYRTSGIARFASSTGGGPFYRWPSE